MNPLTNEILPATYIGLMVPGTGYGCNQVHHAVTKTRARFNGIVTQR